MVVVVAAAGGDGGGTVAAGPGVVGAAVGTVAVDDERASHVALTIDCCRSLDQGLAFAVHSLFHIVPNIIVAFSCKGRNLVDVVRVDGVAVRCAAIGGGNRAIT